MILCHQLGLHGTAYLHFPELAVDVNLICYFIPLIAAIIFSIEIAEFRCLFKGET
jgi:hypothetical protein